MAAAFERPGTGSEEGTVDAQELYAQIGQLRVENEFLKKSCRKLGI
jgi:transposase